MENEQRTPSYFVFPLLEGHRGKWEEKSKKKYRENLGVFSYYNLHSEMRKEKTEKENHKILRFLRLANRNGGMWKVEGINSENILTAERSVVGTIKHRNE